MFSHLLFILQIYDGPNAAAKLIGTYCLTEQVTQIESSSNALFIRMISDFNNQGRGFEMTFRTSKSLLFYVHLNVSIWKTQIYQMNGMIMKMGGFH